MSESTPASAGPRVMPPSEFFTLSDAAFPPSTPMDVEDSLTQMCLAYEDTYTALAAANARIAVLEAGRYAPSLELAFRIARAFGVGVEEVFHWKR